MCRIAGGLASVMTTFLAIEHIFISIPCHFKWNALRLNIAMADIAENKDICQKSSWFLHTTFSQPINQRWILPRKWLSMLQRQSDGSFHTNESEPFNFMGILYRVHQLYYRKVQATTRNTKEEFTAIPPIESTFLAQVQVKVVAANKIKSWKKGMENGRRLNCWAGGMAHSKLLRRFLLSLCLDFVHTTKCCDEKNIFWSWVSFWNFSVCRCFVHREKQAVFICNGTRCTFAINWANSGWLRTKK